MQSYKKLIIGFLFLICTSQLQLSAQTFQPLRIGGYGTVSFQSSTMTDTNAPQICGIPGGAYYWLSYVPSKSGSLLLNTEGSNFDTLLGVFVDNGENLGYASLIQIACDDNSGTNGMTSALQASVTQGVTYYIAVTGKYGAHGQAVLNYCFYESPIISSIATQYIDEEQSAGPINFTVCSAAMPVDSLWVFGNSSDQNLVPDSAIVLDGDGTNRTVTVTPTPYVSGTNVITLTVVDQVGNASSTNFVLQVGRISHPPVAYPAYYTRYPGTSISISVAALLRNVIYDTDTTVSVTGVSPVSQYGSATVKKGANNFVTYSPSPAYNLPDTFTYTITDGKGAVATGVVNILVSPNAGQTVVY